LYRQADAIDHDLSNKLSIPPILISKYYYKIIIIYIFINCW